MPVTEEQIKNIWYPHTTECHSAIERNETGSFAETWVDLKSVIQSEVSQKNKYPMLMHARGIQKMTWMSLFGGQRQTHRRRKWTYGHCSRGKGVRDELRKWRWHIHTAAAKLLQSCPTLCDPTDVSPPGSPVPGILQARALERLPLPPPALTPPWVK